MKISTRGRYALRVMIDLAEQSRGTYVPLKEIAARQEISQKYLESIVSDLSKAKLIDGQHGKGGGYRLLRAPSDYSVGEILRASEGNLAPISCLEKDAPPCPRSAGCKTLPMWKELNDLIQTFFDGKTLADLAGVPTGDDYVI
ncbi:MAG: RrF2 family transcriptional regulator [Clostridia bacterium]|nr:RrF2 family transcriptional regulator [Clostridia bacterium]